MKSNPEIYYTIYKDSSTKSWGVHDNTHTINGRWSEGKAQSHIIVLELTAITFAIRSFLT